jgi:PhnB protein
MQINPYLNFNGQCAEAFRFYEQVFGGKIEMMMTHGESPMAGQVPPDWQDKVMHIRLSVGGQALLGSDSPPEYYQKPQGFYVTLGIDAPADAERIYKALSEDGTVVMPFEKTFWAAGGFGMLVDRFGIPWMVNCEKGA